MTSRGIVPFSKSELLGPTLPESSPPPSPLTKVLTAGGDAMATTKEKKQKLVQHPSKRKNKFLSSDPTFILCHLSRIIKNFYRILVIFHICE
jgi:hypothetical protein